MKAVGDRGLSMYVALQHEPIIAAHDAPAGVPRQIEWTLSGVILVNRSDKTVVEIARDPPLTESPTLLSATKSPILLDTLMVFVAEVAASPDGRALSGPVGEIYSHNIARQPIARARRQATTHG